MSTVLLILLTLVGVAFFSGIEIAFFQANRLRLELKSKQGNFSAMLLTKFIKHPSRFIGVILIGVNISIVIYGSLMASQLQPLIQQTFHISPENELLTILLETFVSTGVVLILGEFLPKLAFSLMADKALLLFAIPLNIAYVLLFPLVWVIVKTSEFLITKVFRLPLEVNTPVFQKIDLDQFIRETSSKNKTEDHPVDIDYFQNALQFDQVKVKECMVPRTEIVSIEINESLEELRKVFMESGHSRIVVYEEEIDNCTGFIHFSALLDPKTNLRDLMHELMIVPESMPALQLFNKFSKEHRSIALVVDEFGGTSGIVTREDLLEEIFGEIEDEYDVDEQDERSLKENLWIFSARLEVDYLNKKYDLQLPEGDYETLGGLLMDAFGAIPEVNARLESGVCLLTVLSVSETRINTVKVEKLDKEL